MLAYLVIFGKPQKNTAEILSARMSLTGVKPYVFQGPLFYIKLLNENKTRK